MKIGDILRENQLDTYKKLNTKTNKKESTPKKECLSFHDFERLMQHDSYERHGRAIRQVRHT